MKRDREGGRACPERSRRVVWVVAVVFTLLPIAIGCQKSEEPSDYIPLLASSKEETQRRAVEELIRMQQKAMPAITQALHSDTPAIRKGALQVLAKIRRSESVTLAGEMVDDSNPDVQHQAITTLNELAQVWKEKSVEYLSHALTLSDPVTVRTAALALAGMSYDPASDALRKAFESGQGMKAVYAAQQLYLMEPSKETANLILEKLGSTNKAERDAAVDAIVGVRDAAGTVTYAGLEDKFVVPLVGYIDAGGDKQAAQDVLTQVRDTLIAELGKILDSKRAAQILEALGAIADKESVATLKANVEDTRLESTWRVAAANALGIAGASSRARPAEKVDVIQELTKVLEDTGEDSRVRIGSAIALCRLKQVNGVRFLLDQLAEFEKAIAATSMTASKRQDLTALRIRAQEALTQSGSFVVPYLMEAMKTERQTREMTPEQLSAWEQQNGRKAPGNITVWAAAKTMGELKVQEAVPYLGAYVTEPKAKGPEIAVDPEGNTSAPLELKDWQTPDATEVATDEDRMEVFAYPGFVRVAAAVALGEIDGAEAGKYLQQADEQETSLVNALQAMKSKPDCYKRAPVVDALIRRHEDVLFYVKLAQKGQAGQ
jgi:HEAT repeat protein